MSDFCADSTTFFDGIRALRGFPLQQKFTLGQQWHEPSVSVLAFNLHALLPLRQDHSAQTLELSYYCLRNRHALIENSTTANASSASKFGHNALHGASFKVTPRMIVTM